MDRLPASAWLAAQAQGLVGVATTATQPGRLPLHQFAARNATEQQMLIDALRLEASQSVRTSVIILAAFNAVAAFATAAGILYEAHLAAQRQQRQRPTPSTIRSSSRSRRGLGSTIQRFFVVAPAEVYPLALSCGITVQSIGFAAVQGEGLSGLLSDRCASIARFMLPAVFLVPYIQLIFAVEAAVRVVPTLRTPRPFAARGRYATAICLGVLGVLLLINLIVATVSQSPNVCFASLFWFVVAYARGGFGVLLTIILLLVLCTGILVVCLTRGSDSTMETEAETAERVATSRMVFFMALAILSNILLLPFFYLLGFHDKRRQTTGPALNVSMVAAVVANLSGLMTGGLRLFLRSSSMSAMGLCGGPNGDHKAAPDSWRMSRSRSNASRIRGPFPLQDKVQEAEQASAAPWTGSARLPSPPPPVAASTPRVASLPEEEEEEPVSPLPIPPPKSRSSSSPPGPPRSLLFLPATTYTIPKFLKKNSVSADKGKDDDLLLMPPPSMYGLAGDGGFGFGGGRHRRDSSMVSSATVQIGLRLSNVLADLVPMHAARPDLLVDKKVYTLDDGPAPAAPAPLTIRRPSPLVAANSSTTDANADDDDVLSDDGSSAYSPREGVTPVPTLTPTPTTTTTMTTMTPRADDANSSAAAAPSPLHVRRDPIREARMKTLPPVPRTLGPSSQAEGGGANPFADSAAVRSPGRSPRGMFLETPRLNTRLSRSNSAGAASTRTGPPPATLLRRENSSASYRPSNRGGSGSEWI